MRKLILILAFFSFLQAKSQDINSDNEETKILPISIHTYGLIPMDSISPILVEQIKPRPKPPTPPSYWKKSQQIGLDLTEVAFVNWNAGGVNSIAGLLGVAIKRNYNRKNLQWRNELLMEYGVNKQKDLEFRKTDDKVELNSTFGYQPDTLSNWYYSAKFNFLSQFTKGYSYPNTDESISQFMAPGYLFLGAGSEYNSKDENFVLYMSPITMKSTFVLDPRLADSGAFGVKPAVIDDSGNIIHPGQNVRMEFGILLTNEYETEIFDNISLRNKLSLYTDYLNKFGNIDVNWEVNFRFEVNEYVVAKISSHLIYDDDVKIKEENTNGELEVKGPGVQWKQQLGIGVIVNL